ncbi:Ger(x)C family spore germination protein [Halalkalibacterium halodurans]|uniref:Ger(x)C family spore germination protein n=1 Tax=Halalkalibacterium halodurans TaxID=86665 RepID=UPI002AAA2A81|nr:Ger(x)C family spore germination protein [Halalkalibacterium halodurans]MDY7222495.1 Ger(x)C family spore germination protein [Halalkalibacterium halodurans]MDY7241716.1 Ger(x)C family spore germination protein [Halalkalibacterium halodurans]
MRWRKTQLLVLFFATLLMSSCWDASELSDLSIISGVGIDKGENGTYKVSFQIINPSEVSADEDGVQQGSTSTVVISSVGNSIFEAVRKASEQLSRRIYSPHTNLVVIGEDFAREEGLNKALDWFERDHAFRTNIPMVIARGSTAEEVLLVQSPFERVPAKKIDEAIKTSGAVWGETKEVEIQDVIINQLRMGRENTISGIKIVGNFSEAVEGEGLGKSKPPVILQAAGMAMFRDGHLHSWLDHKAARGTNWIDNAIESTVVTLPCHNDEKIAIEIIQSNAQMEAKMTDQETLEINLTIFAEGNIGEVNCRVDLTVIENIHKVEKQLEDEIRSEALEAIQISQEEQIDIFGFGEEVHRKYPDQWKMLKDQWNEHFAELQVNVQVNTFIRRTGFRNNPFIE